MPKALQEQDDYYTYVFDQSSVIGVPGTVEEDKLDMIGIVLEELSAYSYNYTREAFFEVALKGRYMRDEQSRQMLDLIVNNIQMDAGWLYSNIMSDIGQIMRTLVKGKNTGWANVYRAKKVIIQNGIDKLNGIK